MICGFVNWKCVKEMVWAYLETLCLNLLGRPEENYRNAELR
jgi:hypothetical protein